MAGDPIYTGGDTTDPVEPTELFTEIVRPEIKDFLDTIQDNNQTRLDGLRWAASYPTTALESPKITYYPDQDKFEYLDPSTGMKTYKSTDLAGIKAFIKEYALVIFVPEEVREAVEPKIEYREIDPTELVQLLHDARSDLQRLDGVRYSYDGKSGMGLHSESELKYDPTAASLLQGYVHTHTGKLLPDTLSPITLDEAKSKLNNALTVRVPNKPEQGAVETESTEIDDPFEAAFAQVEVPSIIEIDRRLRDELFNHALELSGVESDPANFSWHKFDSENHPDKVLRVRNTGQSLDIFIKGSSDQEVFFARIGQRKDATPGLQVTILVPVYKDGELQTELKTRNEVGHKNLPGRKVLSRRVVADDTPISPNDYESMTLSEAKKYDPLAVENQVMTFVEFIQTTELQVGDPKVAQLNTWLKNADSAT